MTGYEATFNNYTRAGLGTKGWFKAPATGNYRFFLACDDACKLWLDSTNEFAKDTAANTTSNMTQIAIRTSWGTWRNYLMTPDVDSSNQY